MDLTKKDVFYVKEEDGIHILLKCSEINKWKKGYRSRKCLIIKGTAYKKITFCTNITKLKNI